MSHMVGWRGHMDESDRRGGIEESAEDSSLNEVVLIGEWIGELNGTLVTDLKSIISYKLQSFKYLGFIVQNDREIKEDVNHRIKVGWLK
ncbi:hypothetical protein MTR_8g092490 [Medicago truncatula]|uniref:Uncharacterized protein n=1 Tax=Medicago truncatula TaxID=3880 RepID=G7LC81_MEDTR|nr:hypothetical protein MTR_8g092490 [Medicago truncatula]